ncbi:MAG TPA: ATP-binding protein, partial [Flavobacterium sp.]|nr:ATP-binding protein [Flavobacterium sp.]
PVSFCFYNTSGTSEIVADKLLFQQAMINVIDNAIKYSVKEVAITIDCMVTGQYFQIRCADNGEGISATSLPYIFEKFYREPKNKHAVKGYGLGLNYAQQIMKAHNGLIEIKSVKGKGTEVMLSWPL